MQRTNAMAAGAVLAALLVLPATAQTGTSEARGTVVDAGGNPIEGAVVTLRAKANAANDYSATTNKKGRFFVAGLWTPKEDDDWSVTVIKAGYAPTKVEIESRTVNRVLIGDRLVEQLTWGEKIPVIRIRPLGSAEIDFVLAPEEVVLAGAAPPAADTVPGAVGASAAPSQNPWEAAMARVAAGDLDLAVPLFDAAIADQPDDAARPEAYAKVLYQLGRLVEAEKVALRAVELAPARIEARMVLYSVYVGQENFEVAHATLEQARALAPQDTRVLDQVAWLALRTGRKEDALAAYRSVVEIDPKHAGAWLSLGDLYAQTGDTRRSEEAYRKVVELNPDEAYQTFYNLGALLINRKDRGDAETQKAIEAFRKAVQIKPDYAQAHQELGLALLGLGDQAGARASLETYLKLRPKAADAAQMQALIQALQKK